jgi:hypothetical protein
VLVNSALVNSALVGGENRQPTDENGGWRPATCEIRVALKS